LTDFCPLSIQPDKLALSYRARLSRFNGWTNATFAARHLEDWVTQQRNSEERLSAVELLAAVRPDSGPVAWISPSARAHGMPLTQSIPHDGPFQKRQPICVASARHAHPQEH